ncbi:MAG: sulfur carrier protein ThiS [Phycisphaeraceae bacterium]|nr:sulfur carrier protein ThiS [Phycisphaeraceae bacterium]
MKIVVNGEQRNAAEGATVESLLKELGLDRQPCAVEVNQRLVTKAKHGLEPLREGDRVEVVTLVGGG